jgi:outer membrane protein assembly factor BamB
MSEEKLELGRRVLVAAILGALVLLPVGCRFGGGLSVGENGGQPGLSLTALPSSAVVVAEKSKVISFQPDGASGWTFTLPDDEAIVAAPVAALSSVTYVRGQQTLYAIAPDGVVLWQSRHQGASDSINGITPLSDSSVAITQEDNSLVAFDEKGQVKWTYNLPDGEKIVAPPVLAASSLVYLRTSTTLYAIDSGGNLAWKAGIGNQ